MNVMRMYTVMDSVAKDCCPPFVCVNDAIALRNFRALLQQVAKVDVEAYELLYIGDWYRETGEVVSSEIEVVVIPDSNLDLIKE